MVLPSPHRISIGLLISIYCLPRPIDPNQPPDASRDGPVVDTLAKCADAFAANIPSTQTTSQAIFILEEVENIGKSREKTFKELLISLGQACGGEALPNCIKEVMQAIDSPDDLITLLALFKDMLAAPPSPTIDGTLVRPTHVEGDSIFGIFLRQLLLDCNGLGFEGLASVLDDLKAYVQKGEEEGRPLMLEGNDEEEEDDLKIEKPAASYALSSRPVQRYLQRRVLELENDVGLKGFDDIENELEQLLRLHPELPRGQFLRYLNSTNHKEFAGALDSVHRYFDYAIRRGGPNPTGKTSQSRNIVQYAVLNLASLHFRFGHIDLALAAINETVRVAQQNTDHLCVAFALAWMYQLLARSGDLLAEEVLFRCIGRASELKLRHLESVASLSLATFEALGVRPHGGGDAAAAGEGGMGMELGSNAMLSSGGGHSRPRRIWNSLRMSVAAELAGLAPSTGAPQPGGPPQPMNAGLRAFSPSAQQYRNLFPLLLQEAFKLAGSLPPHPFTFSILSTSYINRSAASLTSALQCRDAFPLVLEEALKLAGRRCLVAAGSWELLGHRELMLNQARKLLYCYGKETSNLDTSLAMIKVALSRLRGGGEEKEAEGAATSSSSSSSLYGAALDEINAIKQRFPVPIDNLVPHCNGLLLHEGALVRGESRHAHDLGMMLRGLSPPSSEQGLEAHVESLHQWTLQLLESGSMTECVQATQRLASFCEQKGLPWHYMRCLHQLSSAHLRACPSDPCASLPPLLRCLTFCETFDTDPLHAMTSLLLAQVQLRLGSTRKARALIKAALPTLLEHAPVRTQGEAWLTLAKCHLQELSQHGDDGGRGEDSCSDGDRLALLQILSLLDRAVAAFRLNQNLRSMKEVYYLKARLHDQLARLDTSPITTTAGVPTKGGGMDHMALREQAARLFFEVSTALLQRSVREEKLVSQ